MQFRKKPVVISAVQWTNGADPSDLKNILRLAWQDADRIIFAADGTAALLIKTLEGDMRADVGDWIIRGVKDEIYPCKPDIFAATYDAVSPQPGAEEATKP